MTEAKVASATNPLDEAGAVPSLDRFYSKEADDLTDAEIDELIAAHRAERDAYEAAQLAKEEKKSRPKAKASPRKKKTPAETVATEPIEEAA